MIAATEFMKIHGDPSMSQEPRSPVSENWFLTVTAMKQYYRSNSKTNPLFTLLQQRIAELLPGERKMWPTEQKNLISP